MAGNQLLAGTHHHSCGPEYTDANLNLVFCRVTTLYFFRSSLGRETLEKIRPRFAQMAPVMTPLFIILRHQHCNHCLCGASAVNV